jgi:hypothetical protein
MDDGALSTSLDRAERALQRIERALANRRPTENRDDVLRSKVREAVAELDQLIREAAQYWRRWSTSLSPGAPIRSHAARARKRICGQPRGWSTARAAVPQPQVLFAGINWIVLKVGLCGFLRKM